MDFTRSLKRILERKCDLNLQTNFYLTTILSCFSIFSGHQSGKQGEKVGQCLFRLDNSIFSSLPNHEIIYMLLNAWLRGLAGFAFVSHIF